MRFLNFIISIVILLENVPVDSFQTGIFGRDFLPKNTLANKFLPLNSFIGDILIKQGIITKKDLETVIANDDDIDEIEPMVSELFPPGTQFISEYNRYANTENDIDYSNLSVDDPIFLDMDWPKETGPKSAAFAKHMAWRRQLGDVERRRWQKWAIYQRMMPKESFAYSLDDFMRQNIVRDLQIKALDASMTRGKEGNAELWGKLALACNQEDYKEVSAVVKAYYGAWNKRNYENVRVLWLPDDKSELIWPGFERAIGQNEVEKFYRRREYEIKHFGTIHPTIVSVELFGFVAVLKTLEAIGPGVSKKIVSKRSTISHGAKMLFAEQQKPQKHLLTTIVLRKWNNQWRIMNLHASRITHSIYTGNAQQYLPVKTKLPPVAIRTHKQIQEGALEWAKKRNEKMIELTKLIFGANATVSNNEIVIESDKLNRGSPSRILSDGQPTTKVKQDTDSDSMYFSFRRQSDNHEVDIYDYIDLGSSMSKQTILGLRYLFNTRRISKDVKDVLIMDIINSLSEGYASLVEKSFDILVNKVLPRSTEKKSKAKISDSFPKDSLIQCIDEFAGHCQMMYAGLTEKDDQTYTPYSSYYDDDDDDEEEDDDPHNLDFDGFSNDDDSDVADLVNKTVVKRGRKKTVKDSSTSEAKVLKSTQRKLKAANTTSTVTKEKKMTAKAASKGIQASDKVKINPVPGDVSRPKKVSRKKDKTIEYKIIENPISTAVRKDEEDKESQKVK